MQRSLVQVGNLYAGAHHVLARALGEARARRVVKGAWGAGMSGAWDVVTAGALACATRK
jgi:hypothetical protein